MDVKVAAFGDTLCLCFPYTLTQIYILKKKMKVQNTEKLESTFFLFEFQNSISRKWVNKVSHMLK